MAMDVNIKCDQCGKTITTYVSSTLSGIADHRQKIYRNPAVYVNGFSKPRLRVEIRIDTYQANEYMCTACAKKAAMLYVRELLESEEE